MTAQFKKTENIEAMYRKLEEDHQHLMGKYDKLKRSHRSGSELDRVSLMLAELEGKYTFEREGNRKLQARCR